MADTKQKQQKTAAKSKQPSRLADQDLDAVTGGLVRRPGDGTDPCVS